MKVINIDKLLIILSLLVSYKGLISVCQNKELDNYYRIDCTRNFKLYTISSINTTGEYYEIIALDNDHKKYKIISEKNVNDQNNPTIEVGQTYALNLITIEDWLGIPPVIPGRDIIYTFGDSKISTDIAQGMHTLYFTKELNGLFYIIPDK